MGEIWELRVGWTVQSVSINIKTWRSKLDARIDSPSFINTSKQKGENGKHAAYFVDITAVANGGPDKCSSVQVITHHLNLVYVSGQTGQDSGF